MSFTVANARAFLATCRTPARCTLCGAVDPPTRMALCYEPMDSAHVLVHDGCTEHTDAQPAAVVLASRKRLDADAAVAVCEAVIALAERLGAAEAERDAERADAVRALDELHRRIDAAEAIAAGSAVLPTEREIAAVDEAGGFWFIAFRGRCAASNAESVRSHVRGAEIGWWQADEARWWPCVGGVIVAREGL